MKGSKRWSQTKVAPLEGDFAGIHRLVVSDNIKYSSLGTRQS